jgi:catechol 2,3-dioxygenase-like lactoylglutathione lyase family enzyme
MGNWDAFRDYRRSTIWQKIAGSRPVPKRDPLWENCFILGHIGVNVRDLEQAKAYYDMLMPLLRFEPHIAAEDQFAYRPINNEPGTSLFFYPALEQSPYSRHHPGLQHLAFMVESRSAVHAVHTKVLVLGSEVVHSPQVFPQYRPYYFATFWLDPEGFMLEAVCLREEEGT